MEVENDIRDAQLAEVCARVCYRIIERVYKRYPDTFERPHKAVSDLARMYGWNGWPAIEFCLAAYSLHLQRGLLLKFIRTTMVERSRAGHSFRAVYLWSYKANRRRLPPC